MKRFRILYQVAGTVKDEIITGHWLRQQRFPDGSALINVWAEDWTLLRTFNVRICDYIEVDHLGNNPDLDRTI